MNVQRTPQEVLGSWNKFIDCLLEARQLWNTELRGTPREVLAYISSGRIKVLSSFRLANFELILTRFIDYWRAYGGLEAMRIQPVAIKETNVEEDFEDEKESASV